MKKILAALTVLSMLFAFTACKGDDKTTLSSQSTSEITGTTESSTESTNDTASEMTSDTQSTTESSTDKETENSSKPSNTPPTTDPAHKHSYTSKVTTAATCNKEGIKTFTCSCGDTYTEKVAKAEHKWGSWKRLTYAFIDKAGSEQRTCSVCSGKETRKSTANAVANSFQDGGLQYIIWSSGKLDAHGIYPYACHEFHSYIEKPNIPAKDVFTLLSKCFNITDSIKNDIKTYFKASAPGEYGYDAASDTFYMPYNAETGNFLFTGYKHNGGNKYTTYYSYSDFEIDAEEFYWAFEVEYNRSNGQPNKCLSAKKVTSVPDDIVKTDGWREFEGPVAK